MYVLRGLYIISQAQRRHLSSSSANSARLCTPVAHYKDSSYHGNNESSILSHKDVTNMTHREFPVPGPAEDPRRPLVINYRAPYQSPSTDIEIIDPSVVPCVVLPDRCSK